MFFYITIQLESQWKMSEQSRQPDTVNFNALIRHLPTSNTKNYFIIIKRKKELPDHPEVATTNIT